MKKEILNNLQTFANNKILIQKNQSIKNIIDGVLYVHGKYKNEYDNIYTFFDADSVEDIAQNLFSFLKKEVPYKAESEHFQTLRSPTAILSLPADCKSYALFIAGVIDAFNRNENTKIPYSFRFAGYDMDKQLSHVFIVLYPNTKNEIWVDSCLNFLDERKKPYIYKDKIFKPMALYTLNGVNNRIGNEGEDEQSSFDISGWFNTVFDWLDNSTNKWKSRLRNLRNRTPDERLQWYYQQISNNKDANDAIQYQQMFGNYADAHINDTREINYSIAKGYNNLIAQTFPVDKFGGGVGVWNFPYKELFVDLTKTKNQPINIPPDEINPNTQTTETKNVLPLAAGALLLYKIFG